MFLTLCLSFVDHKAFVLSFKPYLYSCTASRTDYLWQEEDSGLKKRWKVKCITRLVPIATFHCNTSAKFVTLNRLECHFIEIPTLKTRCYFWNFTYMLLYSLKRLERMLLQVRFLHYGYLYCKQKLSLSYLIHRQLLTFLNLSSIPEVCSC